MPDQIRDGCRSARILARLLPIMSTITAACWVTPAPSAQNDHNYLHTAIPVDPGTADVQKITEFDCIPLNISTPAVRVPRVNEPACVLLLEAS